MVAHRFRSLQRRRGNVHRASGPLKGRHGAREVRRNHHRHRTGGPGARGPARRGRHAGCHRRAPPLRRHLREHRVHADQDDGGERVRRAPDPPRRGLRCRHRRLHRRRHEARQGAQGQGRRHGEHQHRGVAARDQGRDRARRPCALCIGHDGRGRRAHARIGPHLHQCRRPRAGASDAWRGRCSVLHQLLDDGCRLRARASDCRRRKLHRSRVRPDVPPVRVARHDRRENAADHRARRPRRVGRRDGDPRQRGYGDRDRGRVHSLGKVRARVVVKLDCTEGSVGDGLACAARGGALPEYRRPWARPRRGRHRCARLCQGRRLVADQRARHLCARRLQRRGAFTHTAYNDYEIVADNSC